MLATAAGVIRGCNRYWIRDGVVEAIRRCIDRDVQIVHKYKEGHCVAAALAKLVVTLPVGLHVYSWPSDRILHVLHDDAVQRAMPSLVSF
ncbi:hypothetical protein J1N35_010826 [Gossypium stocksii]|uniref:RNase H type-1 domain-containing protein n=1 Tax=Gossypium stocksii TaxID=47602 RepID=A0A9D3W322_9ROSI|nr:hypothetical protein J1N35_010826 [Gossypium stocksii]